MASRERSVENKDGEELFIASCVIVLNENIVKVLINVDSQ